MNVLSRLKGFFENLNFGSRLKAFQAFLNGNVRKMRLSRIILTLVIVNIVVFITKPFEPEEVSISENVFVGTSAEIAKVPGKIYPLTKVVKKVEVSLRGVPIISSRTASEEEHIAILTRANLYSSVASRNESNYVSQEVERLLIATARDVGFPESEIENVLRHGHCESGWNISARNGVRGGHHGIMQVQGNHWKEFGPKLGLKTRAEFVNAMHEVRPNLQVAYWLWKKDKLNPAFKRIRDGWGPWKATWNCRNQPSRHGVSWDSIITVYRYEESV